MARQSAKPRFPAEDYLNRELGLLAFNRRVLAQAQDDRMPLAGAPALPVHRLQQLDEFFEIRVAGLKEQIKANAPGVTTDGKTPHESFRLVVEEAHAWSPSSTSPE
jgi:polyphosphate kinase